MTICEATAMRIKTLLKEKNMLPYHLEKKSGIAHGTMSAILNAENKDVTFGKIVMIANGFDMSFMEFLNDPLFLSEELEYEF